MNTLHYYTTMAKDVLKDAMKVEHSNLDELYDYIHEIADGCAPTYYSQVLEVASRDVHLALEIPEC